MSVFFRSCLLLLLLISLLTALGCAKGKSVRVEQALEPDFVIECADNDQENCKWPEESLRKRFVRYWDLRSSGPVDELLVMEAPFFQYVVSKEKYGNFFRPGFDLSIDKITIYRIHSVKDDLVEMAYDVRHTGKKSPMGYKSRWVKVSGSWYHVLDNQLIFPEVP